MAVLGICVAERCIVSWLIPKGLSMLLVGGDIALWSGVLDWFGHVETTGRDGCLACLRRCLPA